MYYKINDATYWYEVHGEGTPIVLLHGFTGSTYTWSTFAREWKKEFKIITIDLPGHGQTKTQSPRTMEACCQDLGKLFTHLQLEKIHLVGYSMGGRTALSFAILYPEIVSTLVLESASPGLETKEERHNRIKRDTRLAKQIEQEGVAKFIDFWESIPLFDTQKNLSSEVQQSIRNVRMAQSKEGLVDSLRHMGTGKQPPWWEKLHQFTKPVLLLVGEHDEKYIAINKKMNKRLSTSELMVVKNAGHTIHVEQPEKFGKLITGFILDKT